MKSPVYFISCSGCQPLAQGVANLLQIPLIHAVTKQFADGELLVQVGDFPCGAHIYIFQSCAPYPSSKLHEFALCLDAIVRAQPKSITAVLPYCAYLRQDRQLQVGSSVGSSLIARLLEHFRITKAVCIDPHSIQCFAGIKTNVIGLSAFPLCADWLLHNRPLDNTILVAPDKGMATHVKTLSHYLKLPQAYITKTRDLSGRITNMQLQTGSVREHRCILFDDLLTSGKTILQAAELLFSQGAAEVSACVTHNVLTAEAAKRIANSRLEFLLTTDTVSKQRSCDKLRVLTVADLVADWLKKTQSENI